MPYSCFEVELNENVAHLRMCRPEALNTLSREFWRELPEIVRELDEFGEPFEGNAHQICSSTRTSPSKR